MEFRVSVIIPVYNAEHTVEKAVTSVMSQEGVGEIILAEDGSTDNSYAICLALEQEYKLIRVLTHEGHQNRGASATRNLGIRHAKHEWIQFLDADDELLPSKLSAQLAIVKGNPKLDLIIGSYIYRKNGEDKRVTPDSRPWIGLIESNLGITGSNLWRRDKLLGVGGWDETLSSSQEYDLMFKFLKSDAGIAFDRSFHTLINYQPNSISTAKSRIDKNAVNRIQLRMAIHAFLQATGQLTFLRKVFIHGFIFKNLGYVANPASIYFKPAKLPVFIYRLLNFLTGGR